MELFAHADDGTPLHWLTLLPAGTGKVPFIVGVHGGGWHEGNDGTPINICGADVVAAGFGIVSPEYRLAQPGRLNGQVSNGCYPDQTDDVFLAIQAALVHPRCNGSVQMLGGSAGAYQSAFAAVKGLVRSAVCMSPVTELALLIGNPAQLAQNYAPGHFAEASPNTYITASSKPVFIRSYEIDQLEPRQYTSFVQKMTTAGVELDAALLPGRGHSFVMWPAIKSQAIAWLKTHA